MEFGFKMFKVIMFKLGRAGFLLRGKLGEVGVEGSGKLVIFFCL